MKQWLVILLVTVTLTAMLVESEEFSGFAKRGKCNLFHQEFWRRQCWRRVSGRAIADKDDDDYVLLDVSIRGHSTRFT